MITLSRLKRMTKGQPREARIVNLAALSTIICGDRRALEQRIRRGSPELSAEEQQRIRDCFWLLGLAVREDLPDRA